MSRCQGSDQNMVRKSGFESLLAISRCQGSYQNMVLKSGFEGLLAMSAKAAAEPPR